MTSSDVKRIKKHLNNTLIIGVAILICGLAICQINIHRFMTDILGMLVIVLGIIIVLTAASKIWKFKRFLNSTR